MMSFKLAFKSVKKSFKDYAIYFITLVLGVSIFYMFNSVDSQLALVAITEEQSVMLDYIPWIIRGVSVVVVLILGLLIVFANNFLINRRKKEFGLFMTLGMSKSQISHILCYEVVLVGLISLVCGLIVGIFGSQLMSIIVSKMFEANLSNFTFVFSKTAFIQTIIYFGCMFILVMLLNTITISKYQLIDLMKASKKRGWHQSKPLLNSIIFILACFVLGLAYYIVTRSFDIFTFNKFMLSIGLGVLGTFMFFYSLSGLMLFVLKKGKGYYYKSTNMFVLKQLDHKLHSNVASLSLISLALFFTITIFASGIGLKNELEATLKILRDVDVNMVRSIWDSNEVDQGTPVFDVLKPYGITRDDFSRSADVDVYAHEELLTYADFYGGEERLHSFFPLINANTRERIMHLSQYNQVAKFYGYPEVTLEDDEYIVVSDYDVMTKVRNVILSENHPLQIQNDTLYPKYDTCIEGALEMNGSNINTGAIVVSDKIDLPQSFIGYKMFYGTYKDNLKETLETKIQELSSDVFRNGYSDANYVTITTSNQVRYASVTVSTIVVFVAIYIGLIFMVASSALLALKQLSDTIDYKNQYDILRRIGCDDTMICKALFKQVAIYFMLPLSLAMIHSIFGLQFAYIIIEAAGLGGLKGLDTAILTTIGFMGVLYLLYFYATYNASKQMILKRK